MTRFEQDRAAKLKRILPLRIINALGMIAWQEDRYGCAEQRLRLLHPLAWVWLFGWALASMVLQGIPQTIRDMRDSVKRDAVWW